MAVCRTDDIPGIAYDTWLTASWIMAAVLGGTLHAIGRRHGRSGWQAAGIAVMSVPAWMFLLGAMPDMVRTFCARGDLVSVLPGPPASPPSASRLLATASDAMLRNVGYPLVGLLLWLHGRRSAATDWTSAVRPLVPVGRGLRASALLGVAAFPALAAANLLLAWLTGLDVGTATSQSYYANMTVVTAAALAIAAGVGEELVFRGVMQQGLKRVLGGLGAGPLLAGSLAILLQAVPFAFAHTGYGNPTLLLFNVAFGLLAGLVTQRYGIACAIVLHVLVDFYGFAYLATDATLLAAAAVLAVAIVAVSVQHVMAALRRQARSPRDP